MIAEPEPQAHAPADASEPTTDVPSFNDQPLSVAPPRPAPPKGIKALRRDAITLALSGDGQFLAGGDLAGQALLWDLPRDRFVWADPTPDGNRLGRVAFAGTAPIYMAGAFHEPDRPWRVWSATELERKGELGEAGWLGLDVALDDAGARAVTLSSSRDGATQRLDVWELANGKSLGQHPVTRAALGAVAIDSSGTRFAVSDERAVVALELRGDALAEVFKATADDRVSKLALSGDGKVLYGAIGMRLLTWPLDVEGSATREIGDGPPIRGLHRSRREGLALAVVTRPESGGLRIYAGDGTLVGGLDTGCRCETHALSTDARVAACGCSEASELRWGLVRYE